MPDLVILPGVVTTLAAHPSRLGGGLLFAEVKGPNDALSDRHRVWHDRLLRAGVDVELWHVEDRR